MNPAVMRFAGIVYPLMFVAVGWVACRRATAAGLSRDTAILFVVSAAVGSVIGARVFYLLASGGLFLRPVANWIGAQGTASWGVYLGGLLGALIYGAWARGGAAVFVDALASCAGLGSCIGRWSCLLYGDDFGKPTNIPWAIRFPPGSLPFQAQVAEGTLRSTAEWSLPVHPMQVYLMLVGLLVFVGTSWYWTRLRRIRWSTLGLYFLLEGSVRLPAEFFRDPAAGGSSTFGSTSQLMCLFFIVAGSSLLLIAWKRLGARVTPSPSLLSLQDPTNGS
jgi:phosphatidylglycerol---prolipoprotein diacylglyceryl transferase